MIHVNRRATGSKINEFHKEPSQVTDKLASLHFQGHLGKAPELGSLNMPEELAAPTVPKRVH